MFRFYHKIDKVRRPFGPSPRASPPEPNSRPLFFLQDGRPIYVEQLGKLDLSKLRLVTTDERQLQSLVVEYEKFQRDRLPICSELAGHLIETSCTIMDLKGVGVRQFFEVKGYVQNAATSEFGFGLLSC